MIFWWNNSIENKVHHRKRVEEPLKNKMDEFNSQVTSLREKAPLYPKVYFEDKDGERYVTTKVDFIYEGITYRRHLVQSMTIAFGFTTNDIYEKIMEVAETTIKYGKPYHKDEVIDEK